MQTATEVTYHEKIEKVMLEFPFEKVHAYMLLTNWKWRDKEPTLQEIKRTALTLLYTAAEDGPQKKPSNPDESYMTGTGGFYAYRFRWDGKDMYKLTFEPFKASNF